MSVLDRMLRDARAKGATDPMMLIVSPADADRLGGVVMIRAWCAANDIEPKFSRMTAPGMAYFVRKRDVIDEFSNDELAGMWPPPPRCHRGI